MNIQHFFNDRTEIRTYLALTKAPLAPWIDRYAGHLRQEGYSKQGSCEQLRMLARFNEWLDMQSFTTDTITPDAFEEFRDHLQRQGKLRGGYETALQHLLRIMHPDLCVETPSRLDLLLQGFRDYQLNDRTREDQCEGLAAARSELSRKASSRRRSWRSISDSASFD